MDKTEWCPCKRKSGHLETPGRITYTEEDRMRTQREHGNLTAQQQRHEDTGHLDLQPPRKEKKINPRCFSHLA